MRSAAIRLARAAGVYGLVLALYALALWVELLSARLTGGRFPLIAFSLAIALAASFGGYIPSLILTLLAAVSADYFLLGPGRFFDFPTTAEALALAGFSAGWTVVAISVSRIFERLRTERVRRIAADQAAADATTLADITAALGQARTSAAAIEACVQEPLHSLDAQSGMFLLIDETQEIAAVELAVGYRTDSANSWPEVSLTKRSPLSDAFERIAPITLESAESRRSEYPAAASEAFWNHGEAIIVLPIAIDRRVVAAIRLDFHKARRFSPEDHTLLSMLAVRAAYTLDRTWHEEAAHRARVDAESLRAMADAELAERQKTELALRASETRYRALATRTTRLHALTAALSEAVTIGAVAKAIVHQGIVVGGAAAGEFGLLAGDGAQLEILYAEGEAVEREASRSMAVESGLCSTEALRTKSPVFVGSFSEWQEKFWRSASFAADSGFASMAALPLVVEGAPLGVLLFHFSVPVNFDEEYQALLISVAQHCTQALDRARLYEGAQHAQAQAEAASRLKDDFVSIVSHELRTPLSAILGWTSMLQAGSLEKNVVPRALDAIFKNASRQAKLVDDLLDFSSIAAGRARLELELIDASSLIRGVVESLMPLATGKQITLRCGNVPECSLQADVRRLEQVFVNLLGNALKFTPAGGRVEVEATLVDHMLEVRVNDNGIGINPDFLPHAFDRFRQGDSSTTRNHGGLGLGLSIARQLVESHRGTIAAASDGPGCGTTFTVTLPIHSAQVNRLPEVESTV
jgi:signal transduction histidine kinase